MTKSKKVDSKNSFKSDAGIKSTMLELLQWECLEKSINEKMSAAGGKNLTQKEMEHKNLTLEEKQKQKAALDLRKLRMINNYIFPSMANLVVFFEYAATKELRDSFSAVIQQLLFGRDKNHNETIFYRFITSILALDRQNEKLADFRFVLFEILQNEIWNMIRGLHPYKFSDDSLFHNVIVPDIGRATAWVNSLSREAQANGAIKFNPNKRPVLV